jgi:hypothetical protein
MRGAPARHGKSAHEIQELPRLRGDARHRPCGIFNEESTMKLNIRRYEKLSAPVASWWIFF